MLAAKYQFLDKKLGAGNFKALVSATGTLPASSYIPEHPYSIGLGCADGIGRLILAYKSDMEYSERPRVVTTFVEIRS